MNDPVALRIAEGVAHLRFNRPERLNVLSIDMAETFAAAVTRVLADPSVRVLLLTGAGRSFMAGGDLQGFRDAEDKPAFIAATIDPLHGALKAIAESPLITIVAAQGNVAGAGVSLVAGADLALAAENATFTLAYCRIAGVPDCGGSWSLPRTIGLKAAMAMALTNAPVPAEEAVRIGLITQAVPAERLEAEALALAVRIAAGPADSQGRTKRLLRQSFETDFAGQLDAEKAAFMHCAGLSDFDEGVAAFFDRRQPAFD